MDIALQPKQQIAFMTEATEVLYGGAAGGGKLLKLDTQIATPDGWTTMGEIVVGQRVFDERGIPCNVVAKSKVETEDTYEIEFSDGSKIVAGARHQWVTSTLVERTRRLKNTPKARAKRRENRERRVSGKKSASFVASITARNAYKSEPLSLPTSGVRTTKEIANTLMVRGRTNHCVDVCEALSLPEAELLIEPYVLGAWLGDGTSIAGQITGFDEEVFENVANSYVVTRHADTQSRGVLGLKKHLKQLGVYGNKHVPPAYLRASKDQRLSLLQGLMDTDGTCDTRGHPSFCTTNSQLRDGILELLNSLGIKAVASEGVARLYGRDISQKWTIHFLTSLPVFRIARKLIRQKRTDWRGTHDVRFIVACRKIDQVPMQCIQVDSPSNCYLAGKQMIPTHNSVLLRASLIRWCLEVPGIQVYLFRRTLRDLRDNHLRGPMSFFYMLSEMIRTGHAKYRAVENEFSFWNGSVLHLCYCDSENDVENYRGAEMHVLAMDELTHFTEHQYRFLRHRVRIAGMAVPAQYKARLPRIECASNPGSIGHAWVKRTFIAPKEPLTVWECGPEEGGMTRQYIPAKLSDNIHLMTDDPKYADRLRGMGSDHLVRAILDGDWNIVAGQAFEKLRRDVHGLEPFTPGPDLQICGSLDWGSSRPFSFGLWCVSDGNPLPNGKTVRRGALIRFDEWYGFTGKPNEGLRLEVAEVADGIKEKLRGRRPAYIVADPSMWKVDGGPSHAETMLSRGIVLRKADNSRIAGYLSVRDRIAGDDEGQMLYATTNCHAGFWRTMPDIVMDERHVEDVDSDQEDHCFIADTQVSVYNGPQRIGDLVGTTGLVWSGNRLEKYRSCRLTRRGAETITVHFADGSSVRCTPDHRFMLESGEWCQAKELLGKFVLSYSALQPKNSMERTIGSAGTTFNDMEFDFIGPYGKKITALSRKASMFTTWMRTEVTTIPKTLRSSINQAICHFMGSQKSALSTVGCTLSGSDQKQPSGMEAKKVLHGIDNTTSNTAQKRCTHKQRSNVSTAMKNLKEYTTQFFAATHVRQQHEENQVSMTLIGSVLHAVQHFAQTSTLELKRVLLNVLHNSVLKQGVECIRIEKAEPADVYCLTVPSKGRFNLANGIVVSNCYDDCRYMAMSRPWVRMVEKKKEAPDRWMRAFEREDVAANEWRVT